MRDTTIMDENNHQINKNLLLLDDEISITNSLKRQLRSEGYTIFTVNSGKEGLEHIENNDIGVVISDMMMPEMDGLSFFKRVKDMNKDIVQIILTAHASLDNSIEAINRLHLFGYLTKPWSDGNLKSMLFSAFEHYNLISENKQLQELTRKQNIELKDINENLEDKVKQRTLLLEEALNEGIFMLAKAAEAKDPDTGDHIYRILDMTIDICKKMNLSERETERISTFSIIHDVGKIYIPDMILNKPGSLNNAEWKIMKHHTLAGEEILGVKPFYHIARQIARSHHENWDGSGYPDGLKGEDIPLAARIVAAADVFDALRHKRPYKDAWKLDRALSEMKMLAGKKFDPEVIKVFLEIVEEKYQKNLQRHNINVCAV